LLWEEVVMVVVAVKEEEEEEEEEFYSESYTEEVPRGLGEASTAVLFLPLGSYSGTKSDS